VSRPLTRVVRVVAAGAVVVGLAVGFGGPASIPPAGAQTRPNILLIMTDDQRPEETLSVMRKTRRWLERSGVRYVNAYVTTPLCCPSRGTILTGKSPPNQGDRYTQTP
jgi:hypothetical protein